MGLSLAESRTVLGLSVDSTEEESKSAYKKAALKSHPDKNEHDSTAEFQRVSAAYETITKHFNPPKSNHNHFRQQHSHYYSNADSDDDEEEYYDEDDEDDEGGFFPGNQSEFYQFMFESMFSGGGFSFSGGPSFNPHHRHSQRGFGFGGAPPVVKLEETPEEYSARCKRDREAAIKAEERRKVDDQKEKVAREKAKTDEMNAGAARRNKKLSDKKQKAAAEKAASAAKASQLLLNAQANRSAVFISARTGDTEAVKKGIWENNVDASGVEKLFGLLSTEELEAERFKKEQESNVDEEVVVTDVEEGFMKENVSVSNGAAGKKEENGTSNGNGNSKKTKNKKKKAKVVVEGDLNTTSTTATTATTAKEKGNKGATPQPKATPPLQPKTSNSTSTPTSATTNGTHSKKTGGWNGPKPKSKLKGIDEKETLLHIAVGKGNFELAEWLVDHGSLLEDRDSAHFTPIHYSILSGNLPLLELFLSLSPPPLPPPTPSLISSSVFADPFYPLPLGESLLSLAVSSKDPKVVSLLVPFCSKEDVMDCWNWIEGLQSGKGGKLNAKEKEDLEEIKWALTSVPEFVAPVGYQKRRRVRT